MSACFFTVTITAQKQINVCTKKWRHCCIFKETMGVYVKCLANNKTVAINADNCFFHSQH